MDQSIGNPLLVGLFFILRCLVPLLVMLGVSYLLRRLGFLQPPTQPPADWDNQNNEAENGQPNHSGSLANERV